MKLLINSLDLGLDHPVYEMSRGMTNSEAVYQGMGFAEITGQIQEDMGRSQPWTGTTR